MITDAIRRGDLDRVRDLLDRHPEMLGIQVPVFGSWLGHAAAHGTLAIVEYFSSIGMDVNAPGPNDGRTALDEAAVAGKHDTAAFLLERGASIDTSSSIKNPLFGAIVAPSSEVARLLLEAGIDTTTGYRFGSAEEDVDAVAFAMLQGERGIARMIALWNSNGNEGATEAAMAEGLRIAHAITSPRDG